MYAVAAALQPSSADSGAELVSGRGRRVTRTRPLPRRLDVCGAWKTDAATKLARDLHPNQLTNQINPRQNRASASAIMPALTCETMMLYPDTHHHTHETVLKT